MSRASLRIVEGRQEGFQLYLERGDPVRLGRALTSDLVVQDQRASRTHALVFFDGGTYAVRDGGSSNGTRVNGDKIPGPTALKAGDKIRIGRTIIEYLVEGDAADEISAHDGGATLKAGEAPAGPAGGTLPVGFCEQCSAPLSEEMVASRVGRKVFCVICAKLSRASEESGGHKTSARGTPKHVVGRFEVHDPLGSGAMGVVYKAWDPQSEQWVALKLLKPEGAQSPRLIERFLQEIRVVTSLDHQGIVACVDHGEVDGMVYLAMEFVEGRDLSAVQKSNSAETRRQAVGWILQILDAIGHAHGKGVIHRDLKPGNILLTPADVIKVFDFGIGRIVEETGVRLTATAATMGTPRYMPPEQIVDASRADHRADLYAIAVMLFRLLSGHYPYPSTGRLGRDMMIVLHEEPRRLKALLPQAPKKLDALLYRGMAKEADDRFQSAAEFSAELERILPRKPA